MELIPLCHFWSFSFYKPKACWCLQCLSQSLVPGLPLHASVFSVPEVWMRFLNYDFIWIFPSSDFARGQEEQESKWLQQGRSFQTVMCHCISLRISMLSNDLQGVKLLWIQQAFVHNISTGRQAGCRRPGSCWRSRRRRRRVLSSHTSTKSFKRWSTPVVVRSSCNIGQHFSTSDKTEKWWLLPKPHNSTIVGKVNWDSFFFLQSIIFLSLYINQILVCKLREHGDRLSDGIQDVFSCATSNEYSSH
jgi:hypothetical protein